MSDKRSTATPLGGEHPARERPAGTTGRTEWVRLRAMSDADAEANAARDPENPPASAEWLATARVVRPPEKQPVSLRLDADLLAWFRAQGEGYQTRINAVLRAFYEHHRESAQ